MLDFIYTLFIAPLEFWMQKALSGALSKRIPGAGPLSS